MGRKKKETPPPITQGKNLPLDPELTKIFKQLKFKFPEVAAEIYLASWKEKYKPEEMEEIYRERDKTLIFMPKEYKYKL